MEDRLKSWKGKMSSHAGRLTLIKSVLTAMPIFHMAYYRLSKSEADKCNSIISRDLIMPHLKLIIGTGDKVAINNPHWFQNITNSGSITRVNQLNDYAANWKRNVVNSLYSEEDATTFSKMPTSRHQSEDQIVWEGNPNGKYTVKDGYMNLRIPKYRDLSCNLLRRGFKIRVPFLSGVTLQKFQHLFYDYHLARAVWMESSIGILSSNIGDSFTGWINNLIQEASQDNAHTVIAATLRTIEDISVARRDLIQRNNNQDRHYQDMYQEESLALQDHVVDKFEIVMSKNRKDKQACWISIHKSSLISSPWGDIVGSNNTSKFEIHLKGLRFLLEQAKERGVTRAIISIPNARVVDAINNLCNLPSQFIF
ncbi:reverse transcriptase [Senna tora]|uniref:Reverse transcriptase n=1 Tax=Senna tora TaxID=362788 RepID=A0A835CI65_9FABA|nr:reverse transcriptase [Senna tora]